MDAPDYTELAGIGVTHPDIIDCLFGAFKTALSVTIERVNAGLGWSSSDVRQVVDNLVPYALSPLVARTVTAAVNGAHTWTLLEQAKLEWLMLGGTRGKMDTPFDAALLGGVYHRREVEAMSNGFGLPVSLTCGGWGSRMRWQPVDPSWSGTPSAQRQPLEVVAADEEVSYRLRVPAGRSEIIAEAVAAKRAWEGL